MSNSRISAIQLPVVLTYHSKQLEWVGTLCSLPHHHQGQWRYLQDIFVKWLRRNCSFLIRTYICKTALGKVRVLYTPEVLDMKLDWKCYSHIWVVKKRS